MISFTWIGFVTLNLLKGCVGTSGAGIWLVCELKHYLITIYPKIKSYIENQRTYKKKSTWGALIIFVRGGNNDVECLEDPSLSPLWNQRKIDLLFIDLQTLP